LPDFSEYAVKLLLIPPQYPHPAAEWVGTQNEHSALALQRIVERLVILTPRPYAPRLVGVTKRWRAYSRIPREHVRRGIRIHRPGYPVLPKVLQAFWPTRVAFLFACHLARRLHREVGFDALLSFDLNLTGGLAWRLGRDLGIPACGWATGSDIRANPQSPSGRGVRETLRNLDLVFYQSPELKGLGAELLGLRAQDLPADQHIVQSRGIIEPETSPGDDVRYSVRSRLRVANDQLLILYLGRIVRGKGLFELVEGFADLSRLHTKLVLVAVGSIPGFDHAPDLRERVRSLPGLNGRIQVLPACGHHQIWEYFKAADIFAFPSFKEGMPNSLLEAMLGGLPAVAFSIPSVQEITRFGRGLIEVPAYDFEKFSEAVLELAADPSLRHEIGARGRAIAREQFSAHKSMRAVIDHIRRRSEQQKCRSAT
jgi:glycosyltransferase involved in cell wall biosynthesis